MRLVYSLVLCTLVFCVCCSLKVPPTQDEWNAAIQEAKNFLVTYNLTNLEKANLATGVGWDKGQCVGNIPLISRANFTGFCLEDSGTGVRFALKVSGFPAGINVAATWNRSLIYDRASAMGYEFRTKGVNVALGPVINMIRGPEGGRIWEAFGADPYLTGEAVYQTILGIQDQGVVATAKHFALNEQEIDRTLYNSVADSRTMHEVYLYPFKQAVKAGVGSVMCSYNKVNGIYACENPYLLTQVLKGEFGFKGFVMSDWWATMSGAPSANAGLDMTMPGDLEIGTGTYFGVNLVNDVSSGIVPQERLDDMAARILTPFFLLKQNQNYPTVDFDFRSPYLYNVRDAQSDHATLIRAIGAESNVLLKNLDNALPLSPSPSAYGNAAYTFAVIGADGGPSAGSYGPTACSDHGCDVGTLAQGWGSGTSWFPYLIDPNAAIVAEATKNGQTVVSSLADTIANATQAAAQADVAIVFANADSGEDIYVEGSYGDRLNLSLWHNGDALIQAVASVNSRTIVVVHVVGPVLMSWSNHPNISAIIVAGLPGQESGNSLVDVLFGAVNPSGKLPYTIASQYADYPTHAVNSMTTSLVLNYTEQLLVDYRWFDAKNITPLYEFGFGLSYTTFTYSDLQFSQAPSGCNSQVPDESDVLYTASVTVSNDGSYAGAEIVQLYLVYPAAAGEPPKVLRGFEKVWVPVSGSVTATFSLTRLDLSVWESDALGWVVPTGNFEVLIGASSRDIRLSTSFAISPPPQVTFSTTMNLAQLGAGSALTLSLSSTSAQLIYVPVLITTQANATVEQLQSNATMPANISIGSEYYITILTPINALLPSTPTTIMITAFNTTIFTSSTSATTTGSSTSAGTSTAASTGPSTGSSTGPSTSPSTGPSTSPSTGPPTGPSTSPSTGASSVGTLSASSSPSTTTSSNSSSTPSPSSTTSADSNTTSTTDEAVSSGTSLKASVLICIVLLCCLGYLW